MHEIDKLDLGGVVPFSFRIRGVQEVYTGGRCWMAPEPQSKRATAELHHGGPRCLIFLLQSTQKFFGRSNGLQVYNKRESSVDNDKPVYA